MQMSLRRAFLALDKYLWFQKTRFQLGNARAVLDVGGGDGMFEDAFRASDHEFTILETTKNNHPDVVHYVLYGGNDFPYADGTFDLGLMLQTIEHIPPRNRQHVITELMRVTRHRVILAFPIRRLHFELVFRAIFEMYATLGLGGMKSFYEEHLRYGLPRPENVLRMSQKPATFSECYFGKICCFILMLQLLFPILIPLSPLFARLTKSMKEPEPIFALLCFQN